MFPVGVAMRTRAVEHYEGAFQSSPFLYDGKNYAYQCNIMSSWSINQQCQTILCERPASVHIIE